jgi:hypothetical protein
LNSNIDTDMYLLYELEIIIWMMWYHWSLKTISFIVVAKRQNMFNLISHWITVFIIGNYMYNLKEKN